MDANPGQVIAPAAPARSARIARRLGVAAFMFFLIKGLLWLAVPAILWTQTR